MSTIINKNGFIKPFLLSKAEGARFELAMPCGIRAFQARAIGLYATLP